MAATEASSVPPITALADVTAGTLDALLRSRHWSTATLTGVRAESFGPGQTADSFRLHLEYAGDPGASPSTLVAKFASADPVSREVSRAGGLYQREVNFYRYLAERIAVATPAVLHAELGDDADFALLMEDVAPATVVDQLDGCPPERARVAIRQAAALHGSSWRRPEIAELPWLRAFRPLLAMTVQALPEFFDQFRATYGDLVDPSVLELAKGVVAVAPAWHEMTSDGYALWHHDFRPDNMLFGSRGGTTPLVVVDWQTVSYGPAIADVSYFLGCGLTVEDRRAHEHELVGTYHRELVAAGVDELSFDDCWSAYLDHAVTAMLMAIHASVRVKRTARGDRMWACWLERAAAQLADHDVLARY